MFMFPILAKLCEVFLCFSLLRNTKKIFSTNVPATAITSINGIRVFSIWWVILGHTFLFVLFSPVVGMYERSLILAPYNLLIA
jgi:hypothetical protein